MAKETKVAPAEGVQEKASIEEILTKYSKTIWISFAAALVVAAAIFCYIRFVQQPARSEALAATFNAEYAFVAGDYAAALEGTDDYMGFADVIEEYGCNAPKAVYLYAGVCELQNGNYEEAIAYLKKYKGSDPILKARALCCIGDAQVGLDDYKGAVASYKKAAAQADNVFAATYLLKEGIALEALGEVDAALVCYKTIKEKYPQSEEGFEVDKYITRISTK